MANKLRNESDTLMIEVHNSGTSLNRIKEIIGRMEEIIDELEYIKTIVEIQSIQRRKA